MGDLKLLLAAVAALLAIGLVACGDEDDSASTTAPATSQDGQTAGGSNDGASSSTGKPESGDDKSGSEDGKSGDSGRQPSSAAEAEEASEFVPEQHDDSGGGSDEYRVKGGDNSIQEFGEEATGSEFEEAAAALHNFLDARAAGNWAASCEYLSESFVRSVEQLASRSKELKGAGCGALLKNLTNQAALPLLREEAESADVASLRREDEQAFLIYRGLEGDIMAISMAIEGGEWKVGSISGVPIG
jgi:hypothetical protein